MSAVYTPRNSCSPVPAQHVRDFERLVEPAFAQPCWRDRNGDEPVDIGFARDGASKEPRERWHHAQVPSELQSSDEVIDR